MNRIKSNEKIEVISNKVINNKFQVGAIFIILVLIGVISDVLAKA